MKIAIDASRAINETAGIGRYTQEIIKNLLKIDQKNHYILIFSYFRKSRQKERAIANFKRPNVTIKTLKIPGLFKENIWRWRISWYNRFFKGADVFFAPSFFEVNFGLKIPQVVTIHDLTTFIYPEHRGKDVSKRLSKRALEASKIARKIIAVSKSTALDLEKYLKIPRGKIEVVYPGLNQIDAPSKNLPLNLKENSYILFVGTIEPRKNLIGLFKAYALLPPSFQEKYPLVVVGAKGWNMGKTYDAFNALKLNDKVKLLGYVTDSVLAKLYKEAAVFIYPSFYEGFGLPILEALSFGTPVVTSNVSSLPEVAGKAAMLIDPEKPAEITRAIQEITDHQNIVENLKVEAKKQVEKFNWEESAKKTSKVLEEAANV